MRKSYYFGCWNRTGHYLFDASGWQVYESNLPRDFPIRDFILDGSLLQGMNGEPEGKARLIHIGGWTILTFWDRSIDKRGGCNSSFVLPDLLTFENAVIAARQAFPTIWQRFPFEVVPEHSIPA